VALEQPESDRDVRAFCSFCFRALLRVVPIRERLRGLPAL
jgi:hypothetical protein